uniref:Alkyl transferase n=1 Tax=Panagrolaimus sp. JU765 TaxID=591449 RepID=A0AC34Q4B0_9BILA
MFGSTTTGSSEWLPAKEGQFVPWWGGLAKWLLQFGKIPKHVAFILDGNRRYAKTYGLDTVIKGHMAGFDKITKVLDWCREIGIKEVTLYAFSIENFKRTKDEVDGLMDMAKEKFTKLLDEKEKLQEKQICFRFFGKKELLPKDLQVKMAQIEEFTKNFEK